MGAVLLLGGVLYYRRRKEQGETRTSEFGGGEAYEMRPAVRAWPEPRKSAPTAVGTDVDAELPPLPGELLPDSPSDREYVDVAEVDEWLSDAVAPPIAPGDEPAPGDDFALAGGLLTGLAVAAPPPPRGKWGVGGVTQPRQGSPAGNPVSLKAYGKAAQQSYNAPRAPRAGGRTRSVQVPGLEGAVGVAGERVQETAC